MNQLALARAQLKKFKIRPNKSEEWLLSFLNTYFPGIFIYNGGEIIIEGKIPDFFCVNSKKAIIELIGSKHYEKHSEEELWEKEKLYRKYGFDVIFINQNELKDEDELFMKISSLLIEG